MSLLNTRVGQAIQVLPYAPTHVESEDRDEDGWGAPYSVRAVVSSASSDEIIAVGQDMMNRRMVARVFGGAPQITGRDRVVYAGETWEIDGLPITSKGVSGMKMTTFYITKQGEAS